MGKHSIENGSLPGINGLNPDLYDVINRYLKRTRKFVRKISGGKATLYTRVVLNRHQLQVFTPEEMRSMIEDALDIKRGMLEHKTRKRGITEARHIAMVIISESFPEKTLREIGAYFGDRDHSTVIHAKNTVGDLLDTNTYFKKKYEDVIEYIRSMVTKVTL